MSGFYWLASYPKSGNTWLRLFLENLAAGSETADINAFNLCNVHAASRADFDRILDIASSDLTDDEITRARPQLYEIEARSAKTPLLCKVHDAWGLTPAGEALFPPELTLGAVYIMRDPRDVAASLAHHVNQPVDRAIDRLSDSKAVAEANRQHMTRKLPQRLLSWSQHVESWLNAPVKLMPIKYEDMLNDPVAVFTEIARFLGFRVTPGRIEAAVNAVRFDRLRSAEEAHGFIEHQPGSERFFRRGIAGGWRDSLTPAQIARIEADHGAVMRKLGYL